MNEETGLKKARNVGSVRKTTVAYRGIINDIKRHVLRGGGERYAQKLILINVFV